MKDRRYIADTTLYHFAGELDHNQCLNVARMLDVTGISEILAGISSADELEAYKNSIINATLVVCVNMELDVLREAINFGAQNIHIEIPTSYSQIYRVYGKNKDWVRKTLLECKEMLLETGVCVSVGLLDSSRAEPSFLEGLGWLFSGLNISRICVEDTLGVQPLSSCSELIKTVRSFGYEVGYEGRDQLGMAVANTVQALKSGANFAYCSIGGVGNGCDLHNLLHSANPLFSFDVDRKDADNLEKNFRELRGL